MQPRFHKHFAALTLGLLLLEISIAWFVHDRFVRPFVGDMLVVILLFTFCRTFVAADHRRLGLAVLLFACLVEVGQYFNLVARLGLQDNRIARTVIGTTFDVRDLLAYCTGVLLVLGIDAWVRRSACVDR